MVYLQGGKMEWYINVRAKRVKGVAFVCARAPSNTGAFTENETILPFHYIQCN